MPREVSCILQAHFQTPMHSVKQLEMFHIIFLVIQSCKMS